MTTAIETIIASLSEVFAPLDEKVKADARAWGLARREAINAKKQELSGQRRKLGEFAYYDAVFAVAGGKSWYQALNERSEAGIIEVMDKNTAATIARRNASIATKLTKAEVNEVISSEYASSNDGFDGFFVVETNKGRKVVTINTIYAGGYNIQCLHLRVLVKVK